MIDGDFLIRWTVRLALICYVVAWTIQWSASPRGEMSAWASRWWLGVWALGCLLFLGHVTAAMHFYHHWSHAHAFNDTAAQTEELLGWSFGYGIYFSYLFTLLWVIDVGWSYRQGVGASPWRWVIHAYMFFIAINGAIIFHSGPTRWLGLLACAGLAVLAIRSQTLAAKASTR